jgi:hypothetical protein
MTSVIVDLYRVVGYWRQRFWYLEPNHSIAFSGFTSESRTRPTRLRRQSASLLPTVHTSGIFPGIRSLRVLLPEFILDLRPWDNADATARLALVQSDPPLDLALLGSETFAGANPDSSRALGVHPRTCLTVQVVHRYCG